ncbi:MarR family winged helix-turn-helix transcriptional regulator [Cohnella sp. GCM10027633]|uniref:MarR family winged helix-turn-helix transcriptional regulator n=1 Tax=unclassified Cohnella TaxID=2636738 RepID=UPI0036424258
MRIQDSIGYIIANADRKLSSNLAQLFQPYGVTSEQWAVLYALHANDGVNQKELARLTDKDPANVTRILDQLERKGLVARMANPNDRRSYTMRITRKGMDVARQLLPIEQRFVAEIVSGISEEELEVFRTAMRVIDLNVERLRRDGQA